MSSPNLESLTNELSKLGAHFKRSFGETETPKAPLPPQHCCRTPDGRLTNFNKLILRVNLESWHNELSKFGELSQRALQIWNSFGKVVRRNPDGPLTNPEFLKWSPKLVPPNMLSKNNLHFVTLRSQTVILSTP